MNVVVTFMLTSAMALPELLPLAFRPLPLGVVAPQGWLLDQLHVMASGLSGHLNEFWPDVQDSVWVGGSNDASGAGVCELVVLQSGAGFSHSQQHERGPYWLNGMVPLAALLNASGPSADQAAMSAQVEQWITYVLDHQLPSGWLGPDDGFGGAGNTYWSGWNIAASLLQYASSVYVDPGIAARCNNATLRYIAEVFRRMQTVPFATWSQNRWQDWLLLIQWQMDQAPLGQDSMLWAAAQLVQQQSWDWDAYYDRTGVGRTGAFVGQPMPKFPLGNVSGWTMYDHGVNNGMGTKSCAVWYRQSKNASDAQNAYKKLAMQDAYQGQPHGMFSADECFGGRVLNRGIELCAVVEQAYSLQYNFRVLGDPYFLDRAEQIAFNAQPGTMSGDMWQHQYLQQANGYNAMYDIQDHVWETDGADATGFGVEPNFGCCTANLQQGWPKFAQNILLQGDNDTLVVGMIAPIIATFVTLDSGRVADVVVATAYPFGDIVNVSVRVPAPGGPITLLLRIPGWATAAVVLVNNGRWQQALNGTFFSVVCASQTTTTVVLALNPAVELDLGWGLTSDPNAPSGSPVPFSPNGATVPTTDASADFQYRGGASAAVSRDAGLTDVRSGNPGEVTMALVNHALLGQGHNLTSLSLAFQYVCGYTPPAGKSAAGPTLRIVVLAADQVSILRTLYQSPVLDAYSFDDFTTYSPPIWVNVSMAQVNNAALFVAFVFSNNERNLQLLLPPGTGLLMSVTWAPTVTPQPPLPPSPPGPVFVPTNAVAVRRGALLYSLQLPTTSTVVKIWHPFNNTDVNLVSSAPWNFALDLASAFIYVPGGHLGPQPFGTGAATGKIYATARQVPAWQVHQQAPDEPPVSPITNTTSLGPAVNVTLVPYGNTRLRIAAFPWFM